MKSLILNILILIFHLMFFLRCKPQSTKEKITSTTYEVLKSLKEGDARRFERLIGVSNLGVIGKNEEMIGYDVTLCDSLINKYFGDKMPEVNITELYNHLGEMQVKIQFYKRGAGKQIDELHLSLLFGPPNIIPLDKISGYNLVENDSDSSDFRPLSYWHRN